MYKFLSATLFAYFCCSQLLAEQPKSAISEFDQSALIEAAKSGDVDKVNLILANGTAEIDGWIGGQFDEDIVPSVRVAEAQQWTALHWAVKSGHVEMAKLLLRKGANVSARADFWLEYARSLNHLHLTPFQLAILWGGSTEMAEVFIQNNVDVNERFADETTPLHLAILMDNMRLVKFLLAKGANVNLTAQFAEFGTSSILPLHLVPFGGGNVDMARLLIRNGSDPNALSSDGESPLDFAVKRDRTNLVKFLLENGAKLREKASPLLIVAARNGATETAKFLLRTKGINVYAQESPTLLTALHYAARQNNVMLVNDLLTVGKFDPNVKDRELMTPLLSATAEYGGRKVVRLLLDHGAKIDVADPFGRTPLINAASLYEYKVDVVELLVKRGANVNAHMQPDLDPDDAILDPWGGATALHFAAKKDSSKMAKLLLQNGADANALAANDETPLHWALAGGHGIENLIEIMSTLIDIGRANVSRRMIYNNRIIGEKTKITSLMYASVVSYSKITEYLISKGAEVNAVDSAGWSALHWTLYGPLENSLEPTKETIKILLSKGANLELRDNLGQSVLHFAANSSYVSTVHLFLDQIHGDKRALVDVQNKDGWTPLHFATAVLKLQQLEKTSEKSESEMILSEWKESYSRVADLLISEGANVNLFDKNGRPALYWALLNGFVTTVKLMLEKGATLAFTVKGQNILHMAAQSRESELLQMVVAKLGVNATVGQINARDEHGWTPLHHAAAAFAGNVQVAKVLLANGANKSIESNDGKLPVDVAEQNLNSDLAELLKIEDDETQYLDVDVLASKPEETKQSSGCCRKFALKLTLIAFILFHFFGLFF